jgi:hypothetical protein
MITGQWDVYTSLIKINPINGQMIISLDESYVPGIIKSLCTLSVKTSIDHNICTYGPI